MLVKPQWLGFRRHPVLSAAEDAGTFRVEHPLGDQCVDGGTGREARIKLDQRIGPQSTLLQSLLDPLFDVWIGNSEEAPDVGSVVINHAISELKDVHAAPKLAQESQHTADLGVRKRHRGPAQDSFAANALSNHSK